MLGYGNRIKAAREKAHMTQEELGAHLGITGVTIMRYEKEQREPTLQTFRDISSELDVSISYLLGDAAEPLSPALQRAFLNVLRNRVDQKISSVDSTDLVECFGTTCPYEDIFEGSGTLTIEQVEEMANTLGVPLEYLIAGERDPADCYPFIDADLQTQIDAADARLVDMVHKICGMNSCQVVLPKVWNPAKIDIVREYIKDSQTILQKMLASMESQSTSDRK